MLQQPRPLKHVRSEAQLVTRWKHRHRLANRAYPNQMKELDWLRRLKSLAARKHRLQSAGVFLISPDLRMKTQGNVHSVRKSKYKSHHTVSIMIIESIRPLRYRIRARVQEAL